MGKVKKKNVTTFLAFWSQASFSVCLVRHPGTPESSSKVHVQKVTVSFLLVSLEGYRALFLILGGRFVDFYYYRNMFPSAKMSLKFGWQWTSTFYIQNENGSTSVVGSVW